MRAHPESTGYYPPPARPALLQPARPLSVLFVVGGTNLTQYLGGTFTRAFVHTTEAALGSMLSGGSRLVVIDLDEPLIDGPEVASAAKAAQASVLVTTDTVARVPAMLKVGCDGVLLKPFPPNLLFARLGRMLRELPDSSLLRTRQMDWRATTNRIWPEIACPTCDARGAITFDFAGGRRVWYACLACEATWTGRSPE